MPSFETAIGIHGQAATLRAKRAGILAANLANADTPHYKARDIDFRSALAGFAKSGATDPNRLRRSHSTHFDVGSNGLGGHELMYRSATQASMDQNSVDPSIERAEFLDNALRYQASLRFLEGKFSSLRAALRGE